MPFSLIRAVRASLLSSVGKESAYNAGGPGLIPGLGRPPGEGVGYPLQYSGASLVAQLVKNPPAMQETPFDSWVGKMCWKRDKLPTPVLLGFPCGSAGRESACNAGDLSSVLGWGRSSGEGNGYPLHQKLSWVRKKS